MINFLQTLEYLHEETKNGLTKTYKQAVETGFECFLKEHEDNYNINEARAEFEKSSYYFLILEEFEKYKLETLRNCKNDAQNLLINSIDQANNIDDLRKAIKIYIDIVKLLKSLI